MVERVGTPENDSLLGTAAADLLIGLAGDDILEGLEGPDELLGGPGEDGLRGGAGRDELSGGGNPDLLSGNGGADVLRGGGGADELDGGNRGDVLLGGRGDDTLLGGNGNDDLDGGPGVDFLEGGAGSDRLDGGRGDDLATYIESSEAVVVDLEAGQAVDAAGVVDELIRIEGVIGSSNGDFILGAAGDEALLGGPGNDLIEGGLGADVLFGGAGDDRFIYRDVLEGGDVVADFESVATADDTAGDAVVIEDAALEGFDPDVSDVSAFFDLVDDGDDAELQVDADGGGDDFTTLATLPGLAGATALVVSAVEIGDLTGIAVQVVAPDTA
jgi:Ca2+-binding RTX toxin-like protein